MKNIMIEIGVDPSACYFGVSEWSLGKKLKAVLLIGTHRFLKFTMKFAALESSEV
ncbi:MAG: hypothetical protein L6V84_00520 [Oscillospiraceae bacterium]|nr:MAG: hypothetical protein L6V84_00520 [Oscillospiraceae bacterium]